MAAVAPATASAGRMSEDSVTDNSSSSSSGSGGAAAGGLLVVVYNSLAWPRRDWIRVPVAAAQDARYTLQGEQHASHNISHHMKRHHDFAIYIVDPRGSVLMVLSSCEPQAADYAGADGNSLPRLHQVHCMLPPFVESTTNTQSLHPAGCYLLQMPMAACLASITSIACSTLP
jgi:hypothetical protein